MATHKTENIWVGDMQILAKTIGGEVNFDADDIVGGKGKGVRPKPLLLSSLAGCTAMDVVSLFNKMKAVPESFKVTVEGEMTKEHPKIYNKIKVDYFFTGKELKKDKLEKCVSLSVERYCGVFEMFRSFAKITTEIHYSEK